MTTGSQHDTKKVIQSPVRQLTEKDLAYAALEAAKRSGDMAGVNAARIWMARLQVEEREARMLLLAHVSDRMARDMNRRETWLIRGQE